MSAETGPAEVAARISGLVPGPVVAAVRIGRGGNSRVYRIEDGDGRTYVAKLYARPTMQGLSRSQVEFGALTLMRGSGETRVPRPIAADHDNLVAVYEYVAGEAYDETPVGDSDIDQAVAFMDRLGETSRGAGASWPHPASEACFALCEIQANIEHRLRALEAVDPSAARAKPMLRFLSRRFKPALGGILAAAQQRAGGERRWTRTLDAHLRLLSPSDFGFHNALRAADGKVTFLDFEYFGWDDPAKLLADFVLHPGMRLDLDHKRRFVRGMLACLESDRELAGRFACVYPLFGLKWIVILLNPYRLDRSAAGEGGREYADILAERLDKAEAFLGNIENDLNSFPYGTE